MGIVDRRDFLFVVARLWGLKKCRGRRVNNFVKPRFAMNIDARMWNNALDGAHHDETSRLDVRLDRTAAGTRTRSKHKWMQIKNFKN